jgi:gamma-glutamylcyclotransferase (GGCT)/AIG2-like uncharacterized protein YtfP
MSIEILPLTSHPDLCRFFVYGTLKRGQCREKCWPYRPLRVEPAVIRATLYDMGAYPGIVPGDGLVRGEVWELRHEHLPATLRVLDSVEGFAERDDDLFVRRVVECRLDDGRTIEAWAYYYARVAAVREADRLGDGVRGWSSWPATD